MKLVLLVFGECCVVFYGDFIIDVWGCVVGIMFFLGKLYVNCGIFG